MIGQDDLRQTFDMMLYGEENLFPQFAILIGTVGSGRKTLIRQYFKEKDCIWLEDNKVASVKKMVTLAHKVSKKVFVIADADTMSTGAKNALLKVVEECPNDNYFIMTLEARSNTLRTITSRATVFNMDRYTPDDIEEYYWSLDGSDILRQGSSDDADIVKDICDTPGEVNTLLKDGVQDFCAYVNLVMNNINSVSFANSFKIADKLAKKEDDDGYDLKMFWKVFIKMCFEKMTNSGAAEAKIYSRWAIRTSDCLKKLNSKSVNKSMLIDDWIINIRKIENNGY